jgi:signal transduction histidine kinase
VLGPQEAAALNDAAISRQRAVVERTLSSEDAPAATLRLTARPGRAERAGGLTVVIEDVTQQRMAEQSRKVFVDQATHELRTPLTNIRLYTEQAIEDGDKDPTALAQALNVISSETRRLERIVQDMLSVSEIEAGSLALRRDDVRLDELFTELNQDYRRQAGEKQIVLTFDLPPKLPVLNADRDKLLLALHNLIGNALKYTPQGGSVTVRVSADDAGGVRVDVSDTGIGISEEDQARVFERFYRAKDKRIAHVTGTGIGLTLARDVIRLHGGDIGVESELNKGSTFTLTLPGSADTSSNGKRAA